MCNVKLNKESPAADVASKDAGTPPEVNYLAGNSGYVNVTLLRNEALN